MSLVFLFNLLGVIISAQPVERGVGGGGLGHFRVDYAN